MTTLWFLIYVLATGPGTETRVVIEMPDEATCMQALNRFVYVNESYVNAPTRTVAVVDKVCEQS